MQRTTSECPLTEAQILELAKKDQLEHVTHLIFDPSDHEHAESITTLRGIEKLPSLILLDLSNNAITKIEYLHNCAKLEQLFLGDNLIKTVSRFPSLPRLKVLDLSGNKIPAVPSLLQLPLLQELNLERNSIDSINSLALLHQNKNLSTLMLADNPIMAHQPQTRQFCIYHIPQLNELNREPIQDEERNMSFRRFYSQQDSSLSRVLFPDVPREEEQIFQTDPANLLQEELDNKEQEIIQLHKQLRRIQLENLEIRSKNKHLTEQVALKNKKLVETNKECTNTFSRLFELEQELAFHQLEISMHSNKTPVEPGMRTNVSMNSDIEIASGVSVSSTFGNAVDVTKLRDSILLMRKNLAALQTKRREMQERAQFVDSEVVRLRIKTEEETKESQKLRMEADTLKNNLSHLEERIKSRNQSPKHIVRDKKIKLKEALSHAEQLRESTIGLQRECQELKKVGTEERSNVKQQEYDKKARELEETTKLITQIETELLEAKVLQKRRIMERLRLGSYYHQGSSSRGDSATRGYRSPRGLENSESEDNIDLINLSYSATNQNVDSANQSFIDKENAEMVQEHLEHCLQSLESVGKQLEEDTRLLQKLMNEQKELVGKMQNMEQEISSLQTNIESNEMAIRMLKKKQKKQLSEQKKMQSKSPDLTDRDFKVLCEKMEGLGKTISELAKQSGLKQGTGASRGTMEKLWMNKILNFEREVHELTAHCYRQHSVKPITDVVDGGARLLKECTKNIKSFTGACYAKPGRKGKFSQNYKKVEKLEGEIETLRKKQREEEKFTEQQSQELISEIERLTQEKQDLQRSHAQTSMTVQDSRVYCEKLEIELNQAYAEIETLQRKLDLSDVLDPEVMQVLEQMNTLLNGAEGNKTQGKLNLSQLSGNLEAVQSPARGMSRSCNSVQEGGFDREHLEPKLRSNSFSEIVEGHHPPRYPKIIERRYSVAALSQAESSLKIESLMNSGEQTSHHGKRWNLIGILRQAKEVVAKQKEETEAVQEWRLHKEKVLEFFQKETQELKQSWQAIEEEKARLNLFRKNLDQKYHKLKKEREKMRETHQQSRGAESVEISELSERLSTLRAEERETQMALTNEQKNQEIISRNFQTEIEAYKIQLNKLKDNIHSHEKMREKVHSELSGMKREIEKYSKTREEHRASLERFEEALLSLKKQKRTILEAIEQSKLNLRTMEKEKRKAGKELRELEERRATIEKRVHFEEQTAQDDIDKINKRYSERQQALLQLQYQIDKLEGTLNRKQDAVHTSQQKLEIMREEVEQLSQSQLEVRTVSKKLEMLREQLSEIMRKVEDMKRSREDQARNLGDVREELRLKKQHLSGVKQECIGLEKQKQEYEETLRSWRREVEEKEIKEQRIKRAIEDLEYSRKKKEEILKSLNSEVEEKEKSFDNYRNELVLYVKEMSEIRSDFDREKEELRAEILKYEEHREMVIREIKTKETELSTLVSQLDLHQEHISTKHQNMKLEQEKVQSLVSQLRMEESQLRENMLIMRNQLRSDEQAMENLKVEMEQQKSNVEQLKGEEQVLKKEVSQEFSKLEELQKLHHRRDHEQDLLLSNRLNLLEEKQSLVHIELAILGQPVEKQIQEKITKIVKRATSAKELESKLEEMTKEIQATEEMNTKLEAEVEELQRQRMAFNRLRTSSFPGHEMAGLPPSQSSHILNNSVVTDNFTNRHEMLPPHERIMSSVASAKKLQSSFAESFVNQPLEQEMMLQSPHRRAESQMKQHNSICLMPSQPQHASAREYRSNSSFQTEFKYMSQPEREESHAMLASKPSTQSVNLVTPIRQEERKARSSTFSPLHSSAEYSDKFFTKLRSDLKMMKQENSAIRRFITKEERSRSNRMGGDQDSTTFGAISARAMTAAKKSEQSTSPTRIRTTRNQKSVNQFSLSRPSSQNTRLPREDATTQRGRNSQPPVTEESGTKDSIHKWLFAAASDSEEQTSPQGSKKRT